MLISSPSSVLPFFPHSLTSFLSARMLFHRFFYYFSFALFHFSLEKLNELNINGNMILKLTTYFCQEVDLMKMYCFIAIIEFQACGNRYCGWEWMRKWAERKGNDVDLELGGTKNFVIFHRPYDFDSYTNPFTFRFLSLSLSLDAEGLDSLLHRDTEREDRRRTWANMEKPLI